MRTNPFYMVMIEGNSMNNNSLKLCIEREGMGGGTQNNWFVSNATNYDGPDIIGGHHYFWKNTYATWYIY